MRIGPGKSAQSIASRRVSPDTAPAGRVACEIGQSMIAAAGARARIETNTHALRLAYREPLLDAIDLRALPDGKRAK